VLPASATTVTRAVLAARGLRGFADGLVSVVLALYLIELGFSPFEVGAIVTGTLLGSAALTLAVGLRAHRVPVRTLLLASCGLMAATGVGFATFTTFWPLLAVAVVGTLNPSAGDVSVFLPTEQAFLADQVDAIERPHLYARYNVAGIVAGAVGALVAGVPALVDRRSFLVYTLVAVLLAVLYGTLPAQDVDLAAARQPLQRSRRVVLELAALFSLDSAGSGFVVQSLLVLWLHLRFDLSPTATGTVFFAASLLGAASQLLAGRVAHRLGLVRAMVFTHIPANVLLALAAFAPRPGLAVGALLLRALFAQMDVPARQALVMSVVPAEERAAAASVTNVPRSLASATTPLLGGFLLSRSDIGWPLLLAGATKITYDLLLLRRFGGRLPEVASDP
jgi:MFS family permease